MGVWTGRGIKFLRELNFVAGSSADLVYPNKVTSIDDTLYVVDGRQVLAFGEVIGGQGPIFYYALRNNITSSDYTLVSNLGNSLLGVSFSASKFYTFDTKDVTDTMISGSHLYTRRYEFNKERILRGILFQFKTLPTVTGSNLFIVSSFDDTGTETTLKVVDTTEGLEVELPITDASIATNSIQLKIVFAPSTTTNVCSLKRMTVYHDPAQE